VGSFRRCLRATAHLPMEVAMTGSEEPLSPREPPPAHALRLTFAYRDSDLRLVGSQRVEMMVPPAVTAPPAKGQSGYWLQVTDALGRIVYHRHLHQPIAVDAEVYAPVEKQAITRIPLAKSEGQFSVLMPDLPQAQSFALHGPPDPRVPTAPARELIRLDVDALRKFRPPRPDGEPAPDAPQRN
jgi:hypothetical protein